MEVTDLIATLALVASVVSLTYTIVVDRRHPRMEVRGSIIYQIDRSISGVFKQGPFFSVSATNRGPGRVLAEGMALSYRSPLKRWYNRKIKKSDRQGVVLEALPTSPNQLPKWLEVGESLILLYPSDSEMMQESAIFDCLYLYDSLGNRHWAQRHLFESARQSQQANSADEKH